MDGHSNHEVLEIFNNKKNAIARFLYYSFLNRPPFGLKLKIF